MAGSAQLSATGHQRSNRVTVDRRCHGEHRQRGDIELHVCNLSTCGFMTAAATGLSRGERVIIRLPHIGRIEAHLFWTMGERTGFQFERIIRSDDFTLMIAAMQSDPQVPQDHRVLAG